MQSLEVSGAVRHIYIYIYVIRRLKVKYMYDSTLLKPNLPLGCSGIEIQQARDSHNFWTN
jgi:hypothetical protein